MSAPVKEMLCPKCLRETFHTRHRNGWACRCGSVTPATGTGSPPANSTGRGGTGEGGSSEGGSGVGGSSKTTTAYAVPAYAEMLSGEGLKALDADREFARFICSCAGIEFKQDSPQIIVLGGVEMTVRLWVENNGRYVIRPVVEGERNPSFPGTKVRSLSLGQLYASVSSGRFYRPTGPSLARWKRRALAQWGAVALPAVALKPLPDDTPAHAECLWDGIALLVAVRRLIDPDERALPLTRSFMPWWCGCDEKAFRRAITWLERNEYVGRAGHVAVGKGKDMTMWWVAEQPS